MSKHTPGPWDLNPYNPCLISGQRGADHCNIAETIVIPGHGAERHAIAEANARLIAAAPDMLAVLENIADGPNRTPPEIVAAIAKAEGEGECL